MAGGWCESPAADSSLNDGGETPIVIDGVMLPRRGKRGAPVGAEILWPEVWGQSDRIEVFYAR